ncbi:L-histidine N(alpha)-methyltransferase [Streptacidiphilus sp. N1-10]|uniref:L-histidine N(Alpha)-methyltransferase n=1 Tax=Streptacidiphilus jeojiensis TaxID=3229225 RepID=A0ABV6XN96_9ACTN
MTAVDASGYELDAVRREVLMRFVRDRYIPMRFLYAGPAVDRHLEFAESYSEDYQDGRSEQELSTLLEVLGHDGVPQQLCDIGPSNGVHSAQFVTGLSCLGLSCRRYLGLDFSSRMLDAARIRLAPDLPEDSRFAQWDFEAAPTGAISSWRRPDGAVMLCLLGGTLGNTEDPARTLRHLRASCSPGDALVLGVFAPPPPGEDVVGPYATAVMRDTMTIPLRAAGLLDQQLELRVELIDNAVIGTARIRSDLSLGSDSDTGAVHFAAGDEIRCFLSRRFTPLDVQGLLRAAGWRPLGKSAKRAGSYIVQLAQRI